MKIDIIYSGSKQNDLNLYLFRDIITNSMEIRAIMRFIPPQDGPAEYYDFFDMEAIYEQNM